MRVEHIIENGVEHKRCGCCETYKPIDVFGNSKSTWDKLRNTCKECLSDYRSQTKDQRQDYNKTYWQKTKESQKKKNKEWRENNKDRVKENMRRWLEENKEHKKQSDREYRLNNMEKYKETMRKWRREKYKKLKEEGGVQFAIHKIRYNISRRIREVLTQGKSDTCSKYVGCTLDELRSHLESTFVEGMTWDNYGEWHIDHRIPCAAFNFEDESEVYACFYYKNLQALWARDNIKKKDTYEKEEKDKYMSTVFSCETVGTNESICDQRGQGQQENGGSSRPLG